MKKMMTMVAMAGLVIGVSALDPAVAGAAQNRGSNMFSSLLMSNFVDLDGDGINDNAIDADGDGVADCTTTDAVRPEDGTGARRGSTLNTSGTGTTTGTGTGSMARRGR